MKDLLFVRGNVVESHKTVDIDKIWYVESNLERHSKIIDVILLLIFEYFLKLQNNIFIESLSKRQLINKTGSLQL